MSDHESYFAIPYEKKGRFASYWHQIQEIIETRPESILEVGVGGKFVFHYLTHKGHRVTSLDILADFGPDICGSVLNCPFKSNSFDTVSCCEVLEHLPFENFPAILQELHRIAKNRVVISIPDVSFKLRLWVQLPKIGDIIKLIPFPFKRKIPHVYDGQHYWELGKKDFPIEKIHAEIEAAGFEVLKSYRVFEFYHRFFILQKR